MEEQIILEPHPNGTLLRLGDLWRIARIPDQIPKKRKLLLRDAELAKSK